jgi:hypothetical protein
MRTRPLAVLYGLIALGALIATWTENIAFFGQDHDNGLWDFVKGGYANHASSSLTNDLWFIGLAAIVFMVVESRRLGIKRVWIYIVLSFAIAVSFAFPLFLLARELKLSERGGNA